MEQKEGEHEHGGAVEVRNDCGKDAPPLRPCALGEAGSAHGEVEGTTYQEVDKNLDVNSWDAFGRW